MSKKMNDANNAHDDEPTAYDTDDNHYDYDDENHLDESSTPEKFNFNLNTSPKTTPDHVISSDNHIEPKPARVSNYDFDPDTKWPIWDASVTPEVKDLINGIARDSKNIKYAEPGTEPTTEPGTEPTTEPGTEPTTEPGTEPTAEQDDKPTAEQDDKPTAEQDDKPTAEQDDKPTAEQVNAAPLYSYQPQVQTPQTAPIQAGGVGAVSEKSLVGVLGTGAAELTSGVAQGVGSMSRGLGSAIGQASSGLGSAIGQASSGLGSAIGSIGTGVSEAVNHARSKFFNNNDLNAAGEALGIEGENLNAEGEALGIKGENLNAEVTFKDALVKAAGNRRGLAAEITRYHDIAVERCDVLRDAINDFYSDESLSEFNDEVDSRAYDLSITRDEFLAGLDQYAPDLKDLLSHQIDVNDELKSKYKKVDKALDNSLNAYDQLAQRKGKFEAEGEPSLSKAYSDLADKTLDDIEESATIAPHKNGDKKPLDKVREFVKEIAEKVAEMVKKLIASLTGKKDATAENNNQP